jgi:hypothetical protein
MELLNQKIIDERKAEMSVIYIRRMFTVYQRPRSHVSHGHDGRYSFMIDWLKED